VDETAVADEDAGIEQEEDRLDEADAAEAEEPDESPEAGMASTGPDDRAGAGDEAGGGDTTEPRADEDEEKGE
jgi:hypothetical protein